MTVATPHMLSSTSPIHAPRLLMVTTVPFTLRAFLLPHAQALRACGWRVDAMANDISASEECRAAFDQVWDVQWSRSPLDPRNLLSAPNTLRTLVQQEEYDIVHVHTPIASFVTRLALRQLRQLGKPRVIYTAHGFHFYKGGHPLRNRLFCALEKWAGRWTDSLIVMNEEDREAAINHRIVPPERLHFMHGIGVDLDAYRHNITPEALAEVRTELALPPAAPVFLQIAELIPRKRPADALRAFAKVRRHHDAYLLFAGNGPLLEPMRQLAQKLQVAPAVRFLGFRRDIPRLLSLATATLLTSAHEGLPRCTLESLCVGVPAIGADIRGIHDLLQHQCGLLYPVGDISALANAMSYLITHPDEAQDMGRRGMALMEGPYEQSKIIEAYLQLYQGILDRNTAGHLPARLGV